MMIYLRQSLIFALLSLFFTACEVGITPLEKEFNEAGVATSGVVTEEGDIGTITVEVQEGVDIEELDVQIEIFGEGSEHFTVELDKSAAAYIGEIKVKPEFIVYKDTPFTFFARTIVNGQKLCAKEVQKTVLRTEVAPVADDINVTLGTDGTVTFSLNATDKNGDVPTYEIKTNPKYGTYKVNDDNSITYTLNSAEQTDTFTYVAKDDRSQSTEATVTINISGQHSTDTTEPVITLLGIDQVNLIVGTAYADAGATANDNVDGSISDKISIKYVYSGNVENVGYVDEINTSKVGTYTIYYDVNDTAGNAATRVTRTVTVQPNEISFNLLGEGPIAKVDNAEINGLQLIDMDKDGDLDIFVTLDKGSNKQIIWYKNKGNGTYKSVAINDTNTSEIQAVHAADINGDGYTDVVYGKSKIHMCINDENDTFTCKVGTVNLSDDKHNITDIKVADMDNNNRADIIFSGYSLDFDADGVFLSYQDNDSFTSGPVRISKSVESSNGGVRSLDIGYIEDKTYRGFVFSASYGAYRVKRLNGSYRRKEIEKKTRTITLADFDNSGYMQYVILTSEDGIYAYKMDPPTSTEVDTSLASPTKPSAVDIDGDGGIDILSSSSEENGKIVWYKNTGTGFSTSITIADINNSTVVQAGDMDGDGDVDVVAGDKDGNIFVYFNSLN